MHALQPSDVAALAPVLFGTLVVAGFGAAWWVGVKRRERMSAFARSQGWGYSPRNDMWANRFTGTPFGTGRNRRARNVLTGDFRGHGIAAFDYSYDSNDGDEKKTYSFAVCAVQIPAPMPFVQLTPKTALGRFEVMLGGQDIELESEDFNRRYRVQARNPKFAYDVLPPRTMEALLRRPALHLRLSGADAVCWEVGRHDPVQLLARLDALCALLEGVPSFVWSDLKGFDS